MTTWVFIVVGILFLIYSIFAIWNISILRRLKKCATNPSYSIADEKYFELKYKIQLYVAAFFILNGVLGFIGFNSWDKVIKQTEDRMNELADSLVIVRVKIQASDELKSFMVKLKSEYIAYKVKLDKEYVAYIDRLDSGYIAHIAKLDSGYIAHKIKLDNKFIDFKDDINTSVNRRMDDYENLSIHLKAILGEPNEITNTFPEARGSFSNYMDGLSELYQNFSKIHFEPNVKIALSDTSQNGRYKSSYKYLNLKKEPAVFINPIGKYNIYIIKKTNESIEFEIDNYENDTIMFDLLIYDQSSIYDQ